MTKGADFLAEAERWLRKAEATTNVTLASLQGALLLYERCVFLFFFLFFQIFLLNWHASL